VRTSTTESACACELELGITWRFLHTSRLDVLLDGLLGVRQARTLIHSAFLLSFRMRIVHRFTALLRHKIVFGFQPKALFSAEFKCAL
jgi:hypothetical protein